MRRLLPLVMALPLFIAWSCEQEGNKFLEPVDTMVEQAVVVEDESQTAVETDDNFRLAMDRVYSMERIDWVDLTLPESIPMTASVDENGSVEIHADNGLDNLVVGVVPLVRSTTRYYASKGLENFLGATQLKIKLVCGENCKFTDRPENVLAQVKLRISQITTRYSSFKIYGNNGVVHLVPEYTDVECTDEGKAEDDYTNVKCTSYPHFRIGGKENSCNKEGWIYGECK